MASEKNTFDIQQVLFQLGIKPVNLGTSTGIERFSTGELFDSFSPVNGQLIAKVYATSTEDYEQVMASATAAFETFKTVPAPKRGEMVRLFGDKLRKNKEALGKLVSYEMGKSMQEGYGEVQ